MKTGNLEELQAAKIFSKVSLHFDKIPNSLREILQTYSEMHFFVCYKKSPPEAVSKDDLKMPGKSDEIDDNVMKFIL